MKAGELVSLVALTALSCDSPLPQRGRSTVVSVTAEATPVALDPYDASVRRIGSFAYAGGIEIRGAIHELSDLRIVSGDHLVAVSDLGFLFEARLVFDETGHLSG